MHRLYILLLTGLTLWGITACADDADVATQETAPGVLIAISSSVADNVGDTTPAAGTTDAGTTTTDASTSTSTTVTTVPKAQTHFCFWKVEKFNSAGAAQKFSHYFDVSPDSTLDKLYHTAYHTPAYYPTDYASVYGYAYAHEVDAQWTAATTTFYSSSTISTYGEQKVLQTVRFTTADGTVPDSSVWGEIYVARSALGNGYVSASLQEPYQNASGKWFYFTHCVTRLRLRLQRSSNMTGDQEGTVGNVRFYVPNRCIPTQLDMTLEKGYHAVYADSTATTADSLCEKPVFTYGGLLPSGEYREAGSMYLLLEHYTPNVVEGCEQLPLKIEADYGSTTKHFSYKLNLTPNATKQGTHFRENESYTVRLVFDTDALNLQTVYEDWENGHVIYLPFDAGAGTAPQGY